MCIMKTAAFIGGYITAWSFLDHQYSRHRISLKFDVPKLGLFVKGSGENF